MAKRHHGRGKCNKSNSQNKISSFMTSENLSDHSDSLTESTVAASTFLPDNMAADSELKAFLVKELEKHTSVICGRLDEANKRMLELNNRVDEVEKAVEFNAAKISGLSEETVERENGLRQEIEDLRSKILLAEVYSRRSNLLIFGVPDCETNVREACIQRFVDILGLEADSVRAMRFANIHRLPRMNNVYAQKRNLPTPIIIKFIEMSDRELVLEATKSPDARKKMTEVKFSIQTDLPPELKRKRGLLLKKRFLLKKKWPDYHTKLWHEGTNVFLHFRRDRNSRWINIGTDDELP